MRLTTLTLSLFMLFATSSAQQKVKTDSMLIVINNENDMVEKQYHLLELGNLYIDTDRNKCDSLATLVLNFSTDNDHIELQSEALSLKAFAYYKDQKDDLALKYYKELDSLLLANDIKNDLLIKSKLYQSWIAKMTFTDSGFQQAKEYLDEMLNIAIDAGSLHYENLAYFHLGQWYLSIRNVKEDEIEIARDYYERALKYFVEENDFVNIANVYWSLSSVEKKLGNLDRVGFYLKKRVSILKSAGDESNSLANAYTSLGTFVYEHDKDFKNTIKYYDSAMVIYQNKGFQTNQYRSILLLDYARVYNSKGDFEQAYTYLEKAYNLKDTIDRNRSRQATIEMETKYQTEQKEKEIALLAAENEKVEAEKNNQRNLLLGGLLLTTTTGIFLFLGFRNRKRTNDKLRELDTAKSNFFANISHEFRTPLSLISGPIEQQLSNDNLNAQERQNLGLAKRNTKRLTTLVDQLLDLSKLEAGQLTLRVEEGNLAVFLRSLVGTFEYLAQQNNQKYLTSIELEEDSYWFDRDAVEKITTNLISNALKYSPKEEQISIEAKETDGQLQLTVSNSGVNLSPEVLNSIFDRFVQAEETSAGTGIGLAHTKELVQLHRGAISAESSDNWIRFKVLLPIQESAFKAKEKWSEGHTKSVFKNEVPDQAPIFETPEVFSFEEQPILLIVDDNADLRSYISSLFKDSYKVHTAEDGKEGHAKALDLVPDIIITDLVMPEDDGITMTANCKQNEVTAHIPIIMLTAKAGDENEIRGLETGADAYITKPFNTEILKTTVYNLQEVRTQLQKRFSQEVVLLPKDMAANSVDERFLENLKGVVDSSLIESNFNAEAFAKALGMSRMQLHRKLKALTGLSATEFIRSQRLKLAAAMLKKSDINVSQVGYAVGFNNHSYFTKCFKDQYGVSPSDYAKKA